MKKYLYTFLFFTSFYTLFGQSLVDKNKIVKGTVFLDQNKNGLKESKEKYLKDILISNGVDIVKTDKNGHFSLSVAVGQSIFPILSNNLEYYSSRNTRIVNAHYIYVPNVDSLKNIVHINFPLIRQVVKNDFTFAAVGDVQVDNLEELGYASKTIFSELSNKEQLDFNIFMGDLVNDKMNLMKDIEEQLNYIQTPSFTLIGNHDRNVKNPENMIDVFNRSLGASTYAFNRGKVHFIVLNNVFSTGKNGYEGRVSDDQLEFIKNDLQYVSKESTVVLCQHIPLGATRNREAIMNLLKGFDKVLVLSGHTHIVSRNFFREGTIQELGVGASSGTWWRGEKDIDEVPLSLMQCGAPRGYFTVDFVGGNYSFRFKGIKKDEYEQMHISLDSSLNLFANIYAGSDSSLVEVQVNNSEWQVMNKVRVIDPRISTILNKNKAKIYPSLGSTVLPVRARESNHIWSLDCSKFFHGHTSTLITIRAKDEYGFLVEQRFIVNLN